MAKFVLQDGTEVEAFTAEEMEQHVGGLKAKVDELLTEKKTVAQRAKELEDQQRAHEEERLKEKSQFKELYERAQKEKSELQETYEAFRDRIQRQEIKLASSSIVASLTRDTARAELLAEKAEAMAKHTDDGVRYEIGGVVVEPEKVCEFLRSKFPFLCDGSGATGGGAAGGSKHGGAGKKFNEYSGAELSAIRRENPGEYERLKNEYYGQK